MTKRILIIDDEANIRQMTRLALEAAGYKVGEAASGLEAFAILENDDSWDAVLLDQRMPGMIGTDVLRRIKVLTPKIPVIMVTAFADVELAVEAMKLGASDFVRKPMTPEILRNAVAAAIMKATAVKAESLDRPTVEQRAENEPPPFRTATMNGFTILRPSDLLEAMPQQPNERRFHVRGPNGVEQEIIVEIDGEAFRTAEAVTRGAPLRRAFWTEQAERFLRDFLWNDGGVPANGKLTLKGVEREELEKATQFENE